MCGGRSRPCRACRRRRPGRRSQATTRRRGSMPALPRSACIGRTPRNTATNSPPAIPACGGCLVRRARAADAETTRFYAAPAEVGLYRTDTAQYRDNLASGNPGLWVVLRPTGAEPPYQIVAVTAAPSEGEAFTESGTDLVEPVPMPEPIRVMIEAFIAEHHVEQAFYKRKQKRADPEALAPGRPIAKDDK